MTAQNFPPSTELTIVPYEAPNSFPNYLEEFTDETFNTRVMRITDEDLFNTVEPNLRHNYAKDQPWNANGTLIKLSGYPAAILDAFTFKFLFWLNPPNGEFFWSNTNAQRIFGMQNNTFVRQNVFSQEITPIRTFTDVDEVLLGRYEGNFSNDDRFFPFLLRNGNSYVVESYDLANRQVMGSMNVGRNGPDWVSFSQSGDYVVIQWNQEGNGPFEGVDVYDRELRFLRKLTNESSHGDLGYDAAGNEVYVFYSLSEDNGRILSVNLETGEQVVQFDGLPGLWGGHVSCRNLNRPGFAYISEQGHPSRVNIFQGHREIFALKLDGSGTVERFCHHHSESSIGYYFQPHAVPNRDGNQVIFASNWTESNLSVPPAFVTSSNRIITDVREVLQPEIGVFPNPFSQTIQIDGLPQTASFRIVNLQGQVVSSFGGNNLGESTIDLSQLSSGLYFAYIYDQNNNILSTKKLVKK